MYNNNLNSIAIRKATIGDRDEIFNVLRSVNMHYIPSAEVEQIVYDETFIATMAEKVVGMAGIKKISPTFAKTTLLAVYPEYQGFKIGAELQHFRMCYARDTYGSKFIKTLSDRPHVIEWYKRKFGYYETGTLDKLCEFGDPNIKKWTILITNIEKYFKNLEG